MNIRILKGVKDLQIDILSVDSKKGIVYEVENTPICQFDQHSRARIGIQFSNYAVCETPEYVLYTNVYDKIMSDQQRKEAIYNVLERLEIARQNGKIKDDYNLMTRNCSYKVTQSWESLEGQMSRRLKFCEEEFIVGLHWRLRHDLMEIFKKDLQNEEMYNRVSKMLPGCDKLQECDYASADYLSNAFGCLFAGCGRWPSHAQFASFNQSCTTPEILEEQLGIKIQRP